MEKEQIMLQGSLGDKTIDGAAHCNAFFWQSMKIRAAEANESTGSFRWKIS